MAIMISIQPPHTSDILNGNKILEIRSTCPKEWKDYLSSKTKIKPKAEKVYIYETKGREFPFNVKIDTIANDNNSRFLDCQRGMPPIKTRVNNKGKEIPYLAYGRAKVVACFTLNEVEQYGFMYSPLMFINSYFKVKDDELTNEELDYDKCCISKKELMEYANDGKLVPKPLYVWHIDDLKIYDEPKSIEEFGINRPPQSWQFIKD